MSVLAADLSQSLSSSKRELETDSTVKTGHTSGSGYVSTIWYGQEGMSFWWTTWMPQKVATAQFSSVQSLSRVWLFATPCTPDLPIHHQLLESTQTHVHWVSNAIQPSHPLSSPSPPALNLSQQQDLFKWVSSSHQVAKVLEFQLQHQSFQWTPRTNLL